MKNLAGDNDANRLVREELFLAGIPMEYEQSKGEVPYKTIGRIGSWTFHRAWYYWIVSVSKDEKGLPLDIAMEMHLRKHPTDDKRIMGESIRSGGHASSPSPDEYGAQPFYDEDLNDRLKEIGEYKEVIFNGTTYPDITVGKISQLCNEGKLKVKRYVNCYHVDDQIGLNVLANVLKKFYHIYQLKTKS